DREQVEHVVAVDVRQARSDRAVADRLRGLRSETHLPELGQPISTTSADAVPTRLARPAIGRRLADLAQRAVAREAPRGRARDQDDAFRALSPHVHPRRASMATTATSTRRMRGP